MISKNFCNWQFQRECDNSNGLKFKRNMQVTDNLVARLGLEKELEGHSGCVNCLEWNQSGNLLASGSDDQQIILWNPFTYKKLLTLQSGHQGNIFSVKFLPNSRDSIIASGAADSKVLVHDVESRETTMVCCCHLGRVKRLAVAPNVPNMFWSAGEDGLVLQYDIRQPHHCSSITNNVFIDLVHHIGSHAEAKCVTVNPLRPEMLAIGANDAYVRLFDRRMVSPSNKVRNESYFRSIWNRRNNISSNNSAERPNGTQMNLTEMPTGCAKYFVAGHIPKRADRRRFRSCASTYLAFSPDGSELLVNLGGEQIYLFDILNTNNKPMAFDLSIAKNGFNSASTSLMQTNGYHLNGTTNGLVNNLNSLKSNKKLISTKSELPQKIEELKKIANEKFENGKFSQAIESYNKAINLYPNAAVLYGNRAAALMKRNWDGDLYAAIRDCQIALSIDHEYFKAHFRLVKCLYELHWNNEAQECLKSYKINFPDQAQNPSFKSLDKNIQQAIFAKSELSKKDASTNDMKSDKNSSDNSDNSASSTNTETPSNKSTRESISNFEKECRALASDYKTRFCGHCNTTTDIKEANFFGSNGQYIIAGSDDGSFFMWDRNTTNIVRVLRGDDSIVNCLQPHNDTCLLATSGIDPVIRLWSPRPDNGLKEEREVENCEDAAQANQKRMNADPLEVMLMNMGYNFNAGINYGDQDDDDDEHVVQCRPS